MGDIYTEELNEHGEEELVLRWNERQTKTCDGTEGEMRPFPPTLYPNHTDMSRCPVQTYLKYKENCPASMMEKTSPFYLNVNTCKHPKALGSRRKQWVVTLLVTC